MKYLLAVALALVVAVSAAPRTKRQAYQLPDGVEFIVGSVRTTFQCQGNGYFADIDNNCQIFHVCHTHDFPDGRSELFQYSFFCGNQTVFNQLTHTCAGYDEAIPCSSSADFFYLNSRVGNEREPFLQQADIDRAAPLITRGGGAPAAPRPAPGGRPRPFPGRR